MCVFGYYDADVLHVGVFTQHQQTHHIVEERTVGSKENTDVPSKATQDDSAHTEMLNERSQRAGEEGAVLGFDQLIVCQSISIFRAECVAAHPSR